MSINVKALQSALHTLASRTPRRRYAYVVRLVLDDTKPLWVLADNKLLPRVTAVATTFEVRS